MPSKSIEHHKTKMEHEEVEEEPIATARAQEQQRWTTVKA
jgi:hypothetical protein